MGGLTFLNDTGLPTVPPAYSSNVSQHATPNGGNGARTMVSTNGGDIPSSTNGPVDKRMASPLPPARSRSKSDGDVAVKDDHRTALNQANGFVRALAVLAKTERSRGDVSPPPLAEERALHGTNGVSAVVADATDADLETARLELMTNLVHIFARNPRVRWEIQVKELIAGYALSEFTESSLILCRIIPSLSDSTQLLVRIAAYRLMRYAMSHRDGPELFSDFDGKDLGWFVVR